MAIHSREELKRYFRKGEYPTEEQFGALIESMRHRGERLGITEVNGLAGALNEKLGRGEAGTLRALLEEFGGFGALGFSGIDRETREAVNFLPERVELTAALLYGSVGVVYNTVAECFLLRLESPLGIKYHSYWTAVDGSAGRVVSGSSDYRAGVLLMTVESGLGMFYTWQGAGEPRRLGASDPSLVETVSRTAATLAGLVDRLAELPVVDFDAVSLTSLPATPWPGEISTLGCTFRVIYGENFGQFLLEVSTIRGSDTARYTSWDEIRASDGKVLVRPSTDYNDYDGESGTYAPLSGRLFHRAGTASLPAAFYAWDGEGLREVNSFAGTLASLSGSIETLSSALGLHTSRLDRHEERLGDLVYKTNKLRTDTDGLKAKADELRDNLASAARMALDAQNQSDDNAAAIEELRAAVAALGGTASGQSGAAVNENETD